MIDHTTIDGGDDRTGSPISRDSVVAAGLTVIARDGFDQLSVRRLAAEMHYSASAIAYYVTPMARYVSSLWATIYDDVIADAMNAAGRAGRDRTDPDPWARRTAEIIVCWADREPNLAEFYVAHTPRPDHMEVGAGHCAVTPAQWAEVGEELRNAWWYFVRRSQAGLQLVLTLPCSERVGRFADEIAEITREWTAARQEILERSAAGRQHQELG